MADTLRLSDVTEINYFKKNPRPFCLLAKELYPGNFAPTPVHYFIKLLADKGVCQTVAFCGVRPHFESSSVVTSDVLSQFLVRNYTQNIDGLEFIAGLSRDAVVQAHGGNASVAALSETASVSTLTMLTWSTAGFDAAHCVECSKEYPADFCKTAIEKDEVLSYPAISAVSNCLLRAGCCLLFWFLAPRRFLAVQPVKLWSSPILCSSVNLCPTDLCRFVYDVHSDRTQDHPRTLNFDPAVHVGRLRRM